MFLFWPSILKCPLNSVPSSTQTFFSCLCLIICLKASAVDCLLRYIRVELLKTKYATTTDETFKQMIKHKQPKNVWVFAGTEFKGNFKTRGETLKLIKISAKRSLLLLKGTSTL